MASDCARPWLCNVILLFYRCIYVYYLYYTYTCDNNYFSPLSLPFLELLPPSCSVSQTKPSSAAIRYSTLKIRLRDSNKTTQTECLQSVFPICKNPKSPCINLVVSLNKFIFLVRFSTNLKE